MSWPRTISGNVPLVTKQNYQVFQVFFPPLAHFVFPQGVFLTPLCIGWGFFVSKPLFLSMSLDNTRSNAGVSPWRSCFVFVNRKQSRSFFLRALPDFLRLRDSNGFQRVLGSGGNNSKLSHRDPEQDRTQIFIKTLFGKTICRQIWTGILIKNLKEQIQAVSGIPSNLLCLVHAGKILQENFSLQHYGIGRDSTITLSTRLRGGSSAAGPKGFQGSTSKPSGSYRDAAKGKAPSKGKEPAAFNIPPGQYIVDQTPEIPSISLDIPEVMCIFSDMENKAVICRFNGFWPKTEALYQWIHTVWTKDCQIHLC